jgi:hypothetical protein
MAVDGKVPEVPINVTLKEEATTIVHTTPSSGKVILLPPTKSTAVVPPPSENTQEDFSSLNSSDTLLVDVYSISYISSVLFHVIDIGYTPELDNWYTVSMVYSNETNKLKVYVNDDDGIQTLKEVTVQSNALESGGILKRT